MAIFVSNGPVFDNYGSKLSYSGQHFGPSVGCYCFHSALISNKDTVSDYSEGQRSRSSKNEGQGHKKLRK